MPPPRLLRAGRVELSSSARPRRWIVADTYLNCTSPMVATTQQNLDIRGNGSAKTLATECQGREASFGEVRLRALTIFTARARASFLALSGATHTGGTGSTFKLNETSPPHQEHHRNNSPSGPGSPRCHPARPSIGTLSAVPQKRIHRHASGQPLPIQRAQHFPLESSRGGSRLRRLDARHRIVRSPEAVQTPSFLNPLPLAKTPYNDLAPLGRAGIASNAPNPLQCAAAARIFARQTLPTHLNFSL